MYAVQAWSRDRITSVIGVGLVHALLGYALIFGLRSELPRKVQEQLKLVDLLPQPDPPKPRTMIPHRVKSSRPEGEASPPNLRAEPTQIVLPSPIVPLPVTSPVMVAPIAGVGAAPSAGSADIPGPGYGAGGFGNGRGAGGYGDGDGDGGWIPPRHRKGRIRDSDYPRGAGEGGVSGRVGVRYVVEVDGRVSDCDITSTSGSSELDDTTCRLIRERFRFDPSRDPDGRPVPATIVQNHIWTVRDEPPEEAEFDR